MRSRPAQPPMPTAPSLRRKTHFRSGRRLRLSNDRKLLIEIARRLKARTRKYGVLESLNNGKTISEAQYSDLSVVISQFELFAGAAYHLHGETHDYADTIGLVHREPIGVCAQIIPWNVPLVMMAAKIAPALATGNTVVLKPAETVCLSIMEFFREMADLLPPGVVNVLTGYGADVGEALVAHPDVAKVAFTGSVATARKVMQYASVNVIPQTLELGGKSAHIICADADIDAAVESAILSTVFNKGEVCLAGSRLYVHEAVYEEFLEKFSRGLSRVRQGDPLDYSTQLGAQASLAQLNKICGYLELGTREGAQRHLGGARARIAGFEQGYFVQPTVFTNVRNDMRIAQEEIFGPVVCVMGWRDENDMLRAANRTNYGLAGGVWTRDVVAAHRIARKLETGTVYVNRYFNIKTGMPIGGYKQSGFGREFCIDTLEHYTRKKSVLLNLEVAARGLFQ